VFENIKKTLGKEPEFIFRQCVDVETGDIPIKKFVDVLFSFSQSLTRQELFKTCHYLDEDGSGSISLDEFIFYFGEQEDDGGLAERDSLL